MIELTQLAPRTVVASFDAARNERPMPLALCWAVWIAASAGLWALALKTLAWLF